MADETREMETAQMIQECNEWARAAKASLAEIREAIEDDKQRVKETKQETDTRRAKAATMSKAMK